MISVIIPAYNCEHYLSRAVDSVLAQRDVETEIIIINDGSTDQTERVARSFGDAIHYIEQTNQGVSAARNRGLEVASGDYIAFLDADDTWFPDKLSTQLAVMEKHPDHVGVFSNFTIVDCDQHVLFENGIENEYSTFKAEHRTPDELFGPGEEGVHAGNMYGALYLGNFINTCSLLLSASAVREAGGFDTTLDTQEDYDYWLRLSRTGPLLYLDQPLLTRSRRPGQLTDSSRQLHISRDVVSVMERHAPHVETQLGKKGVHARLRKKYHSLVLNLLGEKKPAEARTVLFRSIKQTSLDGKTILLLLWSLVPSAAADSIRHRLLPLIQSGKARPRQLS